MVLVRPITTWYKEQPHMVSEAECAGEQLEALANKYGVTYLDEYRGLYTGADATNTTAVYRLLNPPGGFEPRALLADNCHPSPLGGSFLSAMLLHALGTAHARWRQHASLSGPNTDTPLAHVRPLLPPPLARSLRAGQPYGLHCMAFEPPPAAGLASSERRVGVLPPVIPKEMSNWEYRTFNGRRRLVSTSQDADLTVEVGAKLSRAARVAGDIATVVLEYVESDLTFAVAQVQCIAGCACKPVRIDAHTHERRSTPASAVVLLSLPHTRCVLRITLLNESRPPQQATAGHPAFQLVGLSVGVTVSSTAAATDVVQSVCQRIDGVTGRRFNGTFLTRLTMAVHFTPVASNLIGSFPHCAKQKCLGLCLGARGYCSQRIRV